MKAKDITKILETNLYIKEDFNQFLDLFIRGARFKSNDIITYQDNNNNSINIKVKDILNFIKRMTSIEQEAVRVNISKLDSKGTDTGWYLREFAKKHNIT